MRTLKHDVSGLTASNPYTGTTQKITNYLADPAEMAILHMVNADLARTPTFALFARPDYFLSPGAANCSTACVSVNSGFAYNHGDYAAEINTKHLGLAGPGVKHLGLDGQAPGVGPNSAGPNSGQVPAVDSGTMGTWVDETGNSCRSRREETPLRGVDQPGDGNGGREVDQQVDVVRLAVELGRFGPEVPAHVPHDLLYALQEGCGEHRMPVLGHAGQVGMRR